jgi:prepilin-type N-terminal cleavage/methylation domain-containing protein
MMMRPTRKGFSLVELLVVIAIIAVLSAIGVYGTMRVMAAQKEARTTETIEKIQIGFEQQWKAALDAIKKEPIPDPVRQAAGGDQVRARVIHTMCRMRQEFPMHFGEVTTYSVNGYNYPPKQSIQIALSGISGTPSESEQAAVLLMLAVAGSRSGVTFDAEGIGGGAVVTRLIAGKQFKIYVDAWGSPIGFEREAEIDEHTILAELNGPPYAAAAVGRLHPLDPEGRVTGQIALRDNQPFLKTDGANRRWFIYSAGRNRNYWDSDDIYSYRLRATDRGN